MQAIITTCVAAAIATAAAWAAVTDHAHAAGLTGELAVGGVLATQTHARDGYSIVDYRDYHYSGSTPPNNGNAQNADPTRSYRPNEQPQTTCNNVRVNDSSGRPSWKQVCRTGFF